jgi:quercetin dioxygenase-like cupin family protein
MLVVVDTGKPLYTLSSGSAEFGRVVLEGGVLMMRALTLSMLVLVGLSSVVWSQSAQQEPPPQPNPENFVGKVTGHPTTDIRMLRYSFEPGARTNWHSHEGGQVILIEKGHARVQEAGGAIREMGPRESFVTAAGVKHWHGAVPTEGLTQVSLSFGATNWMEKVSDAQYTGKAK